MPVTETQENDTVGVPPPTHGRFVAWLLHDRPVGHSGPHRPAPHPTHRWFRYLISGEGDVPPVTREVLRRAEPVRSKRPWVHVG